MTFATHLPVFEGLRDYINEIRGAHGGASWYRNHWLWLYLGIILQTCVVLMPHDWHFTWHFGLAFIAALVWAFSGGLKYEAMMAETVQFMAEEGLTAEQITEALDEVEDK